MKHYRYAIIPVSQYSFVHCIIITIILNRKLILTLKLLSYLYFSDDKQCDSYK